MVMRAGTWISFGALIVVTAGLGALLGGCGGGDSAGETGTLQLLLTDAPAAEIAEVHVRIVSLQVVSEDNGPVEVLGDADIDDDIELIALAQDTYDLGGVIIAAGQYNQIRMIVSQVPGDNWLRTTAGETHDLTVPSGGQTGIKLVTGPVAVVADQPTILLLDFDAAASVHQAGASGQWIMRPVIRASQLASVTPALGSVIGAVLDGDGNPLGAAEVVVVVLLNGEGEIVAVEQVSADDGSFEIPSVLVGDYTLQVFYADVDLQPTGDALSISVDGGAAGTSYAVSVADGQTVSLAIVGAG
jgi:hypothetical protein